MEVELSPLALGAYLQHSGMLYISPRCILKDEKKRTDKVCLCRSRSVKRRRGRHRKKMGSPGPDRNAHRIGPPAQDHIVKIWLGGGVIMPHGNSPLDTHNQSQQPTKSSSGNDGDQQKTSKSTPQSPAPAFAQAISSPGPQSPGYQIQQLIMSRNPVAGQNVNITLQNVGQVVAGNQQITLASLPITNPASPGFQFSSQSRRFEHGSPSYIQVTSPISQQVQTQSPTQPNAVPIQALQGVRATAAGSSLGMCNQATTPGFVDAGLLVRQLSLGPSSTGHFVYQEGSGITQIAPGTQVHLPSGTSTPVQTHTLLHSNSQTVGSVHQFGSQNTTGAGMQTLASAGHITTTNIPRQIGSIIQGQFIQQQQVLHGQQLGKTISFDRTSGEKIAGASAFGITQQTPTSPSRTVALQGLSSLPLSSTMSKLKQAKKVEEIPPATAEDARLRKQCLEHHHKAMKMLKEIFRDSLTELFFLQHCQGNMMDFLAFRKKPTLLLQTFLRQSDLDLEVEEEEEMEKSPVVVTMQSLDVPFSPVSECPNVMEMQDSFVQTGAEPTPNLSDAICALQLASACNSSN
ncbi:unnamed protein product [Ranitomeya imitator]|uniref:E1A-binding protein p400 N-terminal domain-containing protein n=1 Tax=Ranitomeya imitator TaxID=111125 RepID=A0ABN9LMT8_9NEOB|nr:unnamed protein product [Ranitomeya imitator]